VFLDLLGLKVSPLEKGEELAALLITKAIKVGRVIVVEVC
jgi:hypothetical protein